MRVVSCEPYQIGLWAGFEGPEVEGRVHLYSDPYVAMVCDYPGFYQMSKRDQKKVAVTLLYALARGPDPSRRRR